MVLSNGFATLPFERLSKRMATDSPAQHCMRFVWQVLSPITKPGLQLAAKGFVENRGHEGVKLGGGLGLQPV